MKKQGLIAGFAMAAAMAVGAAAFAADTAPRIADRMPDGTVYASVSPDTNNSLFTTPADAPGIYTWDAAQRYCSTLEASGHKDWRLPTKDELNVLFQNRAAIGGFNISGADSAGWYWSSSQFNPNSSQFNPSYAWGQRFSDGVQGNFYRDLNSSLRCVR